MKTITVMVTKTYYKAITVDVQVPEHLTNDELHTFIEKREQKDSNLSDKLADASLNADMDGIEIEVLF